MAMSHSSTIEDIVSITSGFLEAIACKLSEKDLQPECGQVLSLELPKVDSRSLHQELSKRNISTSTKASLVNLLECCQEEMKVKFFSTWKTLMPAIGNIDNSVLDALRRKTASLFCIQAEGVEQGILSKVDKGCRIFDIEAEASAQSESESCSEDGLLIPRGHSRLAIMILEKAYTRTANISRAERIRLAALTELTPRQVTIWFQNRRNRKAKALASKTGNECELTPVCATPIKSSRKRKAEGLYDGETRQPSQRMRTSTPDNSCLSRYTNHYTASSSSSSSSVSSFDTLASFGRGRHGKQRNDSSDSSELEGVDPVGVIEFGKNDLGQVSTPFAMGDNVVEKEKQQLSCNNETKEEDALTTMLFSETGVTQLDFDDLGLDLDSMVIDLPSFGFDFSTFALPQPIPWISDSSAKTSVNNSPLAPQPCFATPQVPTSTLHAATILNNSTVDALEEIRRAQQIEEWAFGTNAILEEDTDNKGSYFLNLSGLRSAGTDTPSSTSEASTDGNGSSVVTPNELFDFSLQGLYINQIMVANLATFEEPEDGTGTSKSISHHLPLETMAANESSFDDAMATARDTMHC